MSRDKTSDSQTTTPAAKGIAFNSLEPEFDENTYIGRFEAFRAVANPLHAFYSNTRILEMKAKLKKVDEEELAAEKATGIRSVMR
jgi:hypothetical protein